MPNPFATPSRYLGVAKETTRGTAATPVSTSGWVPVRAPAPLDNIKMLDDKGLRGSMVDLYAIVPGVGNGEYSFAGDFFTDTTPNLLLGMLGFEAAVTAGFFVTDAAITGASGTAGTLTSNSANFSASDVGLTITSAGTGSVGVTATIGAVTSATQATIAAASGVTNGALTKLTIARATAQTHDFGLLNNAAATGNQPPSYTIDDFNGNNMRQFTAAQLTELVFKFNADGLLEYTAKFLANLSTTPATVANTITATVPIAAWRGQVVLAGAPDLLLQLGELSFKRPVQTPWTLQNSQNPFRLWAGPMKVEGKGTLIYQGDTELNYYLNNTQPTANILFTQSPTSVVQFIMNQAAFRAGRIPPANKDYIETEVAWECIPNTTNATAGGLGQVRCLVTNALSAAY